MSERIRGQHTHRRNISFASGLDAKYLVIINPSLTTHRRSFFLVFQMVQLADSTFDSTGIAFSLKRNQNATFKVLKAFERIYNRVAYCDSYCFRLFQHQCVRDGQRRCEYRAYNMQTVGVFGCLCACSFTCAVIHF